MTEFALFLSAFAIVFLLGFQSLTVNSGQKFMAFANSFLIGGAHLVLYKLAPNVASLGEIAAYLIGGPLGIISAMYLHRRFLGAKHGRAKGAAR